ncbi:MAG: 50S ribosomal protein L30 [Armatimonadota bacterium]|nr:50S ribosomal protein L30 [Armatimonadota bacterium]
MKKSLIGYPKDQKATAKALGLTRINRVVVKPNNPSIRGMIRKIQHLLDVEEVNSVKE